MTRMMLGGALVAATVALAAAPAVANDDANVKNEKLSLDTFSQGGPNVVSTSKPLAAGAPYTVKVDGTVNIEPIRDWSHPGGCGTPDKKPKHKSPGVTNGPVGWDAETVFAIPAPFSRPGFACIAGAVPFHSTKWYAGGFQINTGAGFGHREPVDGPFSAPRSSHQYTYVVTGSGSPASFRFADFPNDDNYGVLSVHVKRVTDGPHSDGD